MAVVVLTTRFIIYLSTYLPIYLSTYLHAYLFIYLSIYLSSFHMHSICFVAKPHNIIQLRMRFLRVLRAPKHIKDNQ